MDRNELDTRKNKLAKVIIRAPWREDGSEIPEVRGTQVIVKLGQGIQILDQKSTIDIKFGDRLIETLRLLGNPNK